MTYSSEARIRVVRLSHSITVLLLAVTVKIIHTFCIYIHNVESTKRSRNRDRTKRTYITLFSFPFLCLSDSIEQLLYIVHLHIHDVGAMYVKRILCVCVCLCSTFFFRLVKWLLLISPSFFCFSSRGKRILHTFKPYD